MLPVMISSVRLLEVFVDPRLYERFQGFGDHVVAFDGEPGMVFVVNGNRFVVADSRDHEGGGILAKNAVLESASRSERAPEKFERRRGRTSAQPPASNGGLS